MVQSDEHVLAECAVEVVGSYTVGRRRSCEPLGCHRRARSGAKDIQSLHDITLQMLESEEGIGVAFHGR